MKNDPSTYASTIASYFARAAQIAKERGLDVEIDAPFMKLRRRCSSASLIFRFAHILLEGLEVEPHDRQKHFGSALLDDVVAIGEALGLRIDLIAESGACPGRRGLIQSKLESWYRRHEFVGTDDVLMRRTPAVHQRFTDAK
jgi:hypothetical protein